MRRMQHLEFVISIQVEIQMDYLVEWERRLEQFDAWHQKYLKKVERQQRCECSAGHFYCRKHFRDMVGANKESDEVPCMECG
jgi:hypothetical protein